MLGGIAKVVGYAKAPTATYMLRHPVKGVRQWRAARQPRNRATLASAGAAVLAVPVGLWLALRRR
jgi:hypothetical protein